MVVTKITPCYLYQEYNDDVNLQAFVSAQNSLTQSYLDWFFKTPLPVYTNYNVSGELLDWIGEGLYGYPRPYLPYAQEQSASPYNSWSYGRYTYNNGAEKKVVFGRIGTTFAIGISPIEYAILTSETNYATSDNTYKRCLTWNYYKGDDRVFSISWLKRRIKRFLDGVGGTDPGVSETYDVSVTFGVGTLVNIILLGAPFVEQPSSTYNRRAVYNTWSYNQGEKTIALVRGKLLRTGIESGALQLPFQYRYAVYG